MRKVHVVDENGAGVFNRLWDDGADRMEFESRCGWVSKAECARNAWEIRDGWSLSAISGED